MKPNEKAVFCEFLLDIGQFYGQSLHERTLNRWWKLFASLEWKAIEAALTAHLLDPKRGQYMLKPADVTWQLSKLSKTDETDEALEGQALDAWLEVMKVMREKGTQSAGAFEDPLIPEALQAIGGFGALGRSLEKELPFLSKDFRQHYRRLRQKSHPAVLSLPGEDAKPQKIRLGREAQVDTFLKHLFNHRTEVNPHDRTVGTERTV